ncbi:MAG: hypothetical protein V3V78_01635 [Candidatus Woesearchaeota archaeon]
MKSWLKGGLITLSIFAICAIITYVGTLTCGWNPVEGSVVKGDLCKNLVLMVVLYFIPGVIALILGGFMLLLTDIIGFYPSVISSLIISFLIGALIGLIVDKTKSKK